MIDEAVSQAMGGVNENAAPAVDVRRGRRLLRHELFRRLRPLQALDAAAFVEINHLPHTPLSDRCMSRLSWVMTGGAGWLLFLAAATLLDRRRGWRATLAVTPALWLATATVEYPIKKWFRRRRPFISLVASDHRRPQAGQLLLPLRPQCGGVRGSVVACAAISRRCARILRFGGPCWLFPHLSGCALSWRCRQRLHVGNGFCAGLFPHPPQDRPPVQVGRTDLPIVAVSAARRGRS